MGQTLENNVRLNIEVVKGVIINIKIIFLEHYNQFIFLQHHTDERGVKMIFCSRGN